MYYKNNQILNDISKYQYKNACQVSTIIDCMCLRAYVLQLFN